MARRLTGFSTPIIGVSWDPGHAEVEAARRVIRFLEDRRVMFNPTSLEVPAHLRRLDDRGRRFLTDELGRLGDGDGVAPHLAAMRAACRRFLGTARQIEHDGGPLLPWRLSWTPAWTFDSSLGELRAMVGVHVAHLAGKDGLDVEDGLASILPAPDGDDHDDTEDEHHSRRHR